MQGPSLFDAVPRQFDSEDTDLFEELALVLVEVTQITVHQLETQLRSCIQRTAISWSRCKATLHALCTAAAALPNDLEEFPVSQVLNILQKLASSSAWPFLHGTKPTVEDPQTLQDLEATCQAATVLPPEEAVP